MRLVDLLHRALDANIPARSADSVVVSVRGGGFVRLAPSAGGLIRLEVDTPGGQWSETVDGLYDAVATLQLAGVAPGAGRGWAPAFTAVAGSVVELTRRGYDVATTHGSTSSATASRDGVIIEVLADGARHVLARGGGVTVCGIDALDAVLRVEEQLMKHG